MKRETSVVRREESGQVLLGRRSLGLGFGVPGDVDPASYSAPQSGPTEGKSTSVEFRNESKGSIRLGHLSLSCDVFTDSTSLSNVYV